ncbi:MAG: hypothetical protein DRJ63_08890 [Thermoprotei archaeon]|nr:MAG: hypothetical protein DRJ63_08890 [Thermoprotei archaeon]
MSCTQIERLLMEIRKSLEIAKNIVSMDYNEFICDIRNRYTLRLALVEIVESSSSLGLHILREFLGVNKVEGYSHIFRLLRDRGVISPKVGEDMENLAKLRNLIIHRYWEIDDSRIYKEAKGSGLKVVEDFVKEVEEYVSRTRASRKI